MQILVYGAGAVGGYLGGKLAQSGHDVVMVTRELMAESVNSNGLIISEADRNVRTKPRAITSIAQAFMSGETVYDLIIMAMKSYDLASSIDPLVAFCAEPPPIITTQNGISVEAPLIKQFGAEQVIAGSLTTPISKEATNRLTVERSDRGFTLSPTVKGQNITQWVQMFQQAQINTSPVDDYKSMKWSKALLNMTGNALSAILNRPPGAVYKVGSLFGLEVRMLKEALAVMEKLNIPVIDLPGSPATRLAFGVQRTPKFVLKPILTQIVAKGRGGKMPSFHIDLAAGKERNEVIYHNGAVAKAGDRVGVPAPVNYTLADVLMKLSRREYDWRDFDGNGKNLMAELKKNEKRMLS